MINDIAYGNGTFAVTNNGDVLTSSDGINWVTQNVVPSDSIGLNSIIYEDNSFITIDGAGNIFTLDVVPNVVPTTPSSITTDATGVKNNGDIINITWGSSTDSDGDSITYDLDVWNGQKWCDIPESLSNPNYSITISNIIFPNTTDQAKFRVRAYDGHMYSNFVESNTFSVFINNPPSTPSQIITNAGTIKTIDDKVTITWSASLDDTIITQLSYDLDFWNGTSWIDVEDNILSTSYIHTLPMKSITPINVKYRVRAYDGELYSAFIETSTFIVGNTPPLMSTITHNVTTPKTDFDKILISWKPSTDKENNSNISYDLYFYDGANWDNLGNNIKDLYFNHFISQTCVPTSEAKYKIRAYDGELYSAFIETSTFEIYKNKINSIVTNEDKYLGELEKMPNILFSVYDINDSDKINIIVKVDGKIFDNINDAIINNEYSLNLSSIWDNLSEDYHIIKILVSDGINTLYRTYKFYKICYHTPKISGYDANLGCKYHNFKLTYSIHDEYKNTSLTVVEKIDDLILNMRKNCVRDCVYEIDLLEIWYDLKDGWHTISVNLIDEVGNGGTRVYKFYKGINTNNIDSINLIKYINVSK